MTERMGMRERMPVVTATALILLLLPVIGCAFLPRETVPIRSEYHAWGDGRHASTLFVLLPGYLASPKDFEMHGFIAAIRDVKARVDAIAVDAHYGYYRSRTLPKRLHEDVILPARKKGYRSIWIVGISMGGLGALFYEKTCPHMVEGIILLAPFLGDEPVIEEIEKAGGLAQWMPPESFVHKDYQRPLWAWLQNRVNSRGAPLYLGYGDKDRFARACSLLCKTLPSGRCRVLPGGHDWDVWEPLFRRLLGDAGFARAE